MTPEKKERLREEFRKYFATNDGEYSYVANDLEGTTSIDWFLSKLDQALQEQREKMVDRIETSKTTCKKYCNKIIDNPDRIVGFNHGLCTAQNILLNKDI